MIVKPYAIEEARIRGRFSERRAIGRRSRASFRKPIDFDWSRSLIPRTLVESPRGCNSSKAPEGSVVHLGKAIKIIALSDYRPHCGGG